MLTTFYADTYDVYDKIKVSYILRFEKSINKNVFRFVYVLIFTLIKFPFEFKKKIKQVCQKFKAYNFLFLKGLLFCSKQFSFIF